MVKGKLAVHFVPGPGVVNPHPQVVVAVDEALVQPRLRIVAVGTAVPMEYLLALKTSLPEDR
jgi:hypothetical protein